MALQECPCGSKLFPWVEYDARGISIGYVCDSCIKKKKSGYRAEIFDDPGYECDERMDDDY